MEIILFFIMNKSFDILCTIGNAISKMCNTMASYNLGQDTRNRKVNRSYAQILKIHPPSHYAPAEEYYESPSFDFSSNLSIRPTEF